MSPTRTFRLQPTLQEAARVAAALGGLLPARMPREEAHAVEIAMSEVLTNIVQHGYGGGSTQAQLLVLWTERVDVLEIEVRDEGRAIPGDRLGEAGGHVFEFDPEDIAGLPEGGMGLALIRAAFDVVDYESHGGINRLRLQKALPAEGN